jgi:hypothetical protein
MGIVIRDVVGGLLIAAGSRGRSSRARAMTV